MSSIVVGGRDFKLSNDDCRDSVLACSRAYREHLREYSRLSPLEVWYNRLDMESLIAMPPDERAKQQRRDLAEKARGRVIDHLLPRITTSVGGRPRILDQPPVLFHSALKDFEQRVREGLEDYRLTLSEERRVLFDRYRFEDAALKVVGIGSIGTRCLIGLFFSEENYPLMLQFKEARRSVLEPLTTASVYNTQGQRVVMGQRLMQFSSDIFLGWVRGRGGRDFYVLQLRRVLRLVAGPGPC